MKLISFLLIIFLGIANGAVCPDNYNYFIAGKCYRLFPASIKVSSARFQCLSDNGTLPSIHSGLQNNALTDFISNFGIQVWLGITCWSSGCSWDDGSLYDYQNFANGGPDTTLGNCAFLALNPGANGYWDSTDCNFDLRATLCQKDAIDVPTCKDPFSMGPDGRCYYLPPLITNPFDSAESYCANYGAHLVSIENGAQNSIVKQLGTSTDVTEVFIGLSYNGTYYSWTDPQAVYNYTNWAAGYPNNNIGSCVMMDIGGLYDGQWRSFNCMDYYPFACSYGNGNPPPVTTSPSPLPSSSSTSRTVTPTYSCPSNPYYQYSGYIYSPGYPNYYGGSTECQYYLFVDTNNYVAVKFSDFDLKSGDYLDLFDGENNLIVRLQGTINLSQWYTTHISNEMKLVFFSKSGVSSNRGWSLYFEGSNSVTNPTVPASTTSLPPFTPYPLNVCPPMNYYTYGTIVSPGFPSQYGNSLNCTYILQVAQGSVVRLNFETYTLASYDAISIYDGLNEGSPLVYILTGSFDPNNHVFQSTGPYMAVRFLSDSILTAQGFLATFNGVITTGPPATPRPTTTSRPSTIPARKCADGWVHDSYEMYCYKYFPNGLSWDQSLQTCGSQGSQLLTVHDRQQEMDVLDFIRSNQGSLTSRVWIGLKKSFGNWAWSDGTSVSYLAFLPGEPSSAGNCAAAQGYTNPSGWVALDCSTALPFICYHNALSKL